jgi:hypothetical protein
MLAKLARLILAVIGQTGERWAYPGTISAVGLIPWDEALSVSPYSSAWGAASVLPLGPVLATRATSCSLGPYPIAPVAPVLPEVASSSEAYVLALATGLAPVREPGPAPVRAFDPDEPRASLEPPPSGNPLAGEPSRTPPEPDESGLLPVGELAGVSGTMSLEGVRTPTVRGLPPEPPRRSGDP